ncbi:Acid phosphatase 1, putative isoform 3 [Hibiscus syriacus]|uniref:Acid phosphatase 1, putative isoform 3 n=1 Tax=Hibiscus syriacus TaxID=106335 RepID=A0A6A3AK77_HIBSY|nr:Acid phosphatase 1, putative isoform 3 [Hibiscus syriacus]
MVKWMREIFIFFFLAIFSKAIGSYPFWRTRRATDRLNERLTWQLAVEANKVRGWRTVPAHCLHHIETYMTGGQYEQDVNYVVEQIQNYVAEVTVDEDAMDAWILDAWAMKAECPEIPALLGLFQKLVDSGFKVFLITGRDEETLATATIDNLHSQGFMGYKRVIFRTEAFKGECSGNRTFKLPSPMYCVP